MVQLLHTINKCRLRIVVDCTSLVMRFRKDTSVRIGQAAQMTFMVRDNVICKCNLCTCIMSSFKEGLKKSGQSVLDARAQNLYEMTKIEEERFLQECKMKVLRLQNELNKHRDLSVKSTTSLEVGNGFDPKTWIQKRHELARQLRVAKIEYALALKVDEEEFPSDESAENIDVDKVLAEDTKID